MYSYEGFDYDVIVVGSGAGGGMAAKTLTELGQRVLLLEAGRDYDPVTETPMFNWNHEAPLRGSGIRCWRRSCRPSASRSASCAPRTRRVAGRPSATGSSVSCCTPASGRCSST